MATPSELHGLSVFVVLGMGSLARKFTDVLMSEMHTREGYFKTNADFENVLS